MQPQQLNVNFVARRLGLSHAVLERQESPSDEVLEASEGSPRPRLSVLLFDERIRAFDGQDCSTATTSCREAGCAREELGLMTDDKPAQRFDVR